MEFTGERFISTLSDPEMSYEHWHRYLYASLFIKDKMVVDIASGEGYGSYLLANKGARHVLGVDISPEAVETAQKNYIQQNLTFINASISDIPVPSNSVDVLISFETIEHVDANLQHLFLKEIARILKHDGILIISTPNKLEYSDKPNYKNIYHIKEFYKDEFIQFLRPQFKNVELFGQKIFASSYIWPEKKLADECSEYHIKPTDTGFVVSDNEEKAMLYLIAICSNDKHISSGRSILFDEENSILSQKNHIIQIKSKEILLKDQHIAAQKTEYDQLNQYLQKSLDHIRKLEEQLRRRSVRFWLHRVREIAIFLARGSRSALRLALHDRKRLIEKIHIMQQVGLRDIFIKAIQAKEDQPLQLSTTHACPPLEKKPKISLVMPVYNVEPKWLSHAIESVSRQLYDDFEFIIIDDGSTNEETLSLLRQIAPQRAIVQFNEHNKGISGASNDGVALATGDYIALLDHDDELRENALYEVAKAIGTHNPDVLYSDEARIDSMGIKKRPFLKPDWSPDLLRSQMYVGHLLVFRKTLFNKIGGFRSQFDGSQDYDLMLRFSECTSNIHHIPQILYFWREIESSTALNPQIKPSSHPAGLEALDQHLKRVYGGAAHGDKTDFHFVYDARYPFPSSTTVSIIIPTKDQCQLLSNCVQSILDKTAYRNYEIIIMNNESEEEKTNRWFNKMTSLHANIKVIDAAYPFNWSKINNHGVQHARGEVLVFVNNDTVVISPEWLTRICENALRPEVGVVGGLLLYEDGTIQHAGVVVGMGGWADHVFKKSRPLHKFHPFLSPLVPRNVSAVTGACLGIERKIFDEIGRFDENFTICGSDVDLCLKAMKKGFFNLYNPFIRLYHFESKSRTPFIPDNDFIMSKTSYAELLDTGDPYYNTNLSLASVQPALAQRAL